MSFGGNGKRAHRETCAYCGGPESMGFNRDHVVPRSLQRKLREMGRPLPEELCGTVWACFPCNMRKGTRRLVPAFWADRIDLLNELVGGAPFRIWNGDPQDAAYREVHV